MNRFAWAGFRLDDTFHDHLPDGVPRRDRNTFLCTSMTIYLLLVMAPFHIACMNQALCISRLRAGLRFLVQDGMRSAQVN